MAKYFPYLSEKVRGYRAGQKTEVTGPMIWAPGKRRSTIATASRRPAMRAAMQRC